MSGLNVMVVVEHPAIREALTQLLAERGYSVHPAADGIDALRQIYQVLPRVIISDASLPNLAGFDLLSFVRRRFPEVGVIALKDGIGDELAASVTADVVLSMDPLNPELLADVLSGMIKEYPFRVAGKRAGERRSLQRLLAESGSCVRCTQLQSEVSRARMNALLAGIWLRLHPGDSEAERQESEADCNLSELVQRLTKHQQSEHGVPRRKEPHTSEAQQLRREPIAGC